MGGSQRQSGRFGELNIVPPTGIRNLDIPSLSLVSIPHTPRGKIRLNLKKSKLAYFMVYWKGGI